MNRTRGERATIYARQSFDRHGDELAVNRQLDLCREFVQSRGWTVEGEFVDNDTSATDGRERPAFERLLRSHPSRVVVWHVDRLVRLTRDLERVIELGVDVHAVTAGHLDLSNPAGRAVARTVTAWSTYETEQKAVRQKAANDQRAESGKPYRCQRAFGYEPDGLTIREAEANELRAVARAVLTGTSLAAAAASLNDRGIKTAPGNAWRTTTLKAALLSPRNAGLRRHRGEVVGKALWPAILDDDTAVALRAVLTDPARSKRGPSRRYLLSGLMRCGRCDATVVGAFVKDLNKGETYRCPTLHLSRKAPPIDAYVRGVVIARLSQPDAVSLFAPRPADGSGLVGLQEEYGEVRARLDGLAEAYGAGQIDMQALVAGSNRLRSRIVAIEQEVAAAVSSAAVAEVVTSSDVERTFLALSLDGQRQVVDTLMRLTLLPVGSGHRSFDPRTLQIKWRD